MEGLEVFEKVTGRAGQHVAIEWQRQLKTLKGVDDVVTKRSFAFLRVGINYANLASVKDGIASGERDEVQPLPTSDTWLYHPFILLNTKTGEEKLRVYPATLPNLADKRRTEYFVNGQPATFDEVRPLCLASQFAKQGAPAPACFTIKVDDILSIGDQVGSQAAA